MAVEHILACAFASLAVSIDLADDDEIDPDVATDLVEPVAALFRDVPAEDRAALAALLRECAELETDPVRQRSMLALPEDIGLLDEDGDGDGDEG
ncbi:hypothetical protein [Streptomyces hebeiensis]